MTYNEILGFRSNESKNEPAKLPSNYDGFYDGFASNEAYAYNNLIFAQDCHEVYNRNAELKANMIKKIKSEYSTSSESLKTYTDKLLAVNAIDYQKDIKSLESLVEQAEENFDLMSMEIGRLHKVGSAIKGSVTGQWDSTITNQYRKNLVHGNLYASKSLASIGNFDTVKDAIDSDAFKEYFNLAKKWIDGRKFIKVSKSQATKEEKEVFTQKNTFEKDGYAFIVKSGIHHLQFAILYRKKENEDSSKTRQELANKHKVKNALLGPNFSTGDIIKVKGFAKFTINDEQEAQKIRNNSRVKIPD